MGEYEPRKGAREVLDTQVKEGELQANVIELAEACGWLVYHTYDSRRCKPGFPDLVLVKGNKVIFAELKSYRGRLTPDQKVWIGALERADDVAVKVWKPQDWRDIEKTLKGGDGNAGNKRPEVGQVPHRYWESDV